MTSPHHFPIFYFGVSLLLSLTNAADSIQCPPGFLPLNDNKCIQIGTNLTNYDGASQICSQAGGYLVSIQNAIDNNAIAALVSASDKPLWLGLKCTDDQNPYSCNWDDLSGVARYNNFYNGYPIVDVGECVYFMTHGSLAGRWISGDCQASSFYPICEVQPLNPEDNFCTFNKDGYCYYPFIKPLSQYDAEAGCQQYCSDLVSIHNLEENSFVQSVFGNYNASVYSRIGAQLLSNGSFSWSDGSNFDYNNIGYSNPNLGNCTSMALQDDIISKGQWINSNCDVKLPYVCKRKSDTKCGTTPATTPAPDRCEGTQFLNNNGSFYSPNWPNSYFGVQNQCSFILNTPTGTKTYIKFPTFNLDGGSSIELYNHIEDTSPFATLTKYSFNGNYASSTSSMKVVFKPCSGSQCYQSDVYRWSASFWPSN